MKISLVSMCRGEGKVFLLLSVSQFEAERDIKAIAKIGEMNTPVFLTRVNSIDETESKWVCILCQFSVKQKLYILSSSENQKESREEFSAVLDSSKVKWQSRIDGRRKSDACNISRNIDSFRTLNSNALHIDHFYFNKQWEICFSTKRPKEYLEKDFLEGFVFDLNGEILDCKPALQAWNPSPQGSLYEDSAYFRSTLQDEKTGKVLGFYDMKTNKWSRFDGKEEGIALGIFDKNRQEWLCFESYESHSLAEMQRTFSYRHDNALLSSTYSNWFKSRRVSLSECEEQRNRVFDHNILFSIIVPLYKTPSTFFVEMVESVLAQTYQRWELILVNSTPDEVELTRLVERYEEFDQRIKVVTLKENLGITENTNAGLDTVKGDYICFFDHDDTLEPDILFEYACALEKDSDIVLLYCDEDKLLPNGALSQPTFKPDFSIDLLRDNNYVCHMLTVKREVHKKLSTAYKSLDGAQDHSLTLQVAETGGKFCHIPKILYHWRISATSTAANADSKPYATQAGILAVQNHLNRIGVKGSVENLHGWSFRYKTNYEYDDKSLSVVMLPSKLKSFEKWNIESVRVALSSIEAEIIVSDKVDSEVSDVITVPFEGDYVNWVNRAIEKAQNENVIIINSNTFIDGDLWSDIVLGHLSRKDVGIIGTMSCDQYGVVKNAGLAYVPRGIAELSKGMHSESPGYAFRPLSTQNMSAVGCSAVAVRKSDFIKLGCFDEQLEYSLAVVDYCFRVQENGYLVVYTPEVKAVSPMSQDEGYILSAHFLNKWQKKLAFEPDPYFNVNFSREVSRAEQYALS